VPFFLAQRVSWKMSPARESEWREGQGIISIQLPTALSFQIVSDAGLSFLQQAFEDALDVVEKSGPFSIFVYAGNAQHEQSLNCQ